MRVNMDDGDIIDGIMQELGRMVAMTEAEEKKAMKAIGNEIAKNVKAELNRSDEQHRHMQDDVKVRVKNQQGLVSCVIGGGKETAYKWHLLDDGTKNADGSVHTPATHFTTEALSKSAKVIDEILERTEKEVANHDQ